MFSCAFVCLENEVPCLIRIDSEGLIIWFFVFRFFFQARLLKHTKRKLSLMFRLSSFFFLFGMCCKWNDEYRSTASVEHGRVFLCCRAQVPCRVGVNRIHSLSDWYSSCGFLFGYLFPTDGESRHPPVLMRVFIL